MSIKLGNTDINKVYLGNTEITKAYLGTTEIFGGNVTPAFDSGLIINGTFDDASNLTLGSAWSIANGVASFDDTVTGNIIFDVVDGVIPDYTDYTITFTISNATTVARVRPGIFEEGQGTVPMAEYANLSNGTYSISFTYAQGINGEKAAITASTGGGSFDIDNVSLTID